MLGALKLVGYPDSAANARGMPDSSRWMMFKFQPIFAPFLLRWSAETKAVGCTVVWPSPHSARSARFCYSARRLDGGNGWTPIRRRCSRAGGQSYDRTALSSPSTAWQRVCLTGASLLSHKFCAGPPASRRPTANPEDAEIELQTLLHSAKSVARELTTRGEGRSAQDRDVLNAAASAIWKATSVLETKASQRPAGCRSAQRNSCDGPPGIVTVLAPTVSPPTCSTGRLIGLG